MILVPGEVMMNSKRFATAINCMDGRVQKPVFDYMLQKFAVDYVDMITEAGPIKALSLGREGTIAESIRNRVAISVGKHESKFIAVVGHHDCAGNPVEDDLQREQTLKAMQTVVSWGFRAKVIGLWVDDKWEVSEVE
jgi:hypothetical protein